MEQASSCFIKSLFGQFRRPEGTAEPLTGGKPFVLGDHLSPQSPPPSVQTRSGADHADNWCPATSSSQFHSTVYRVWNSPKSGSGLERRLNASLSTVPRTAKLMEVEKSWWDVIHALFSIVKHPIWFCFLKFVSFLTDFRSWASFSCSTVFKLGYCAGLRAASGIM